MAEEYEDFESVDDDFAQVMISGHINYIKLRQRSDGKYYVTFGIESTYLRISYGERKGKLSFIPLAAFGALARGIWKAVKVGDRVFCRGRMDWFVHAGVERARPSNIGGRLSVIAEKLTVVKARPNYKTYAERRAFDYEKYLDEADRRIGLSAVDQRREVDGEVIADSSPRDVPPPADAPPL